MMVYIIMDKTESDIYEPFVCSTRADAEEMIFSLVEETQYEGFCWACMDDEESFNCTSEFILPWEDGKFVNCNSCKESQCDTLKGLLKFFHDYWNFDSWEIVETEVI